MRNVFVRGSMPRSYFCLAAFVLSVSIHELAEHSVHDLSRRSDVLPGHGVQAPLRTKDRHGNAKNLLNHEMFAPGLSSVVILFSRS